MPSKSSSSSSPSSECVCVCDSFAELGLVWRCRNFFRGGNRIGIAKATSRAAASNLSFLPLRLVLEFELLPQPIHTLTALTDGLTCSRFSSHITDPIPPTTPSVQFSHQHNDEPFRIMRCGRSGGGRWVIEVVNGDLGKFTSAP